MIKSKSLGKSAKKAQRTTARKLRHFGSDATHLRKVTAQRYDHLSLTERGAYLLLTVVAGLILKTIVDKLRPSDSR